MIEGIIIATLILGLLVLFIILFIVEFQRRRNLHTKETEMLHSNYKQEILKTQLEIQEQTLKNISQEIHDNIGQVLSLAKLNLATTDVVKSENAQQKVDDSKNLVAKAIQDLRDLSKSLNTDYVSEMGLGRSIEYELEIINKTGSFSTNFEIEGIIYRLEKQKELILFRIVQEIINNIIKHARAKTITVTLDYASSSFSITIHDDGEGFDLNAIQNSRTGLGIKNMHSRAQLVGAEFQISSTLGLGTTVSIKLPLLTE